MATRTKPKPRAKAKNKSVPTPPVKKTTKKTKNIGGEVGPLGWILVALFIGYLGWAVTKLGSGS